MLGELLLDVHDLMDNKYVRTNKYKLHKRSRLYNNFSQCFFKCIYIHADEIMADIATVAGF